MTQGRETNKAGERVGETVQDGPVISCFTRISYRYDFLNRFLSFGRDKAWRNLIVDRTRKGARTKTDRSAQQEGLTILDVCTGTGDMAILFAQEQQTGPVIGVDLSEAMLEIARRKRDRQNLGDRLQFIKADALALPYAREQFDIVTVCFGLRNLTNRAHGVKELLRVLKPGGALFILEFAPRQQGFAGFLYRLYLTVAVPFLGTLISGVPTAYRYLSDSIQAFLDPGEVEQMLHRYGGVRVRAVSLTYGVVYLYSCRKSMSERA